jgi:3-oxoacyl-[acyl-carrier protein] reductase
MRNRARPVALVTGGQRGIGLAIAKSLATAGFDIAITGIADLEKVDGVLAELRTHGGQAMFVRSDLSDLAGHADAVDDVVRHFGGIDCLVNNAGISAVVRGDFLDLRVENFDSILDINLRGTIFFTQAVVRAMLAESESTSGRSVVNITSVSATLSSPERLDYCVTKAGLAAFSRGLTLRLAETGIAVFEVRPGITRSNMTARFFEKFDPLIAQGLVPMKRWGEPEDIGHVVASLAGGGFGFATGTVISADGGLSIGRL